MNKPFILLAIAIASLFGLAYFIRSDKDKKTAEQTLMENEQKRKQEIADSNVKAQNAENIAASQKLRNQEMQAANTEKINGYTTHTSEKYDIVVLILNDNNDVVNSVSSEVARLYRNTGYSVTSSYFTNSFLHSNHLQEIESGNSKTINMLSLGNKIKYLVIGRYNNKIEDGEYAKFLSRANLDVKVISCAQKTQIDGFKLAVTNTFDDKEHAEKGAIDKLIKQYQSQDLKYNN